MVTSSPSNERILQNTSYLTGAFIIQKILSFLYFILIAKALGPYDLGFYDPAKTLIPILLILIDLSFSSVLTREIARTPEKAFTYLSNALAVKTIMAVILLIGFGIFTNFLPLDATEQGTYYLVALIVAFDSYTNTFFSFFRGLQVMKYEAFGMILTQLMTIGVGLALLKYGYGVRGLFAATLMGSIANFIYAMFFTRKRLGSLPAFRWQKKVIVWLLKVAFPFALYAVLAKIFSYTDRLLLFLNVGREFIGYYATAYKLTFALEFIPASFAAAFYPAMSALFVKDKSQLSKIFERSLFYLVIISVPISICSLFIADKIFTTLWEHAYTNSILSFQIMISSLVVIFCNFPVGTMLNATNRQKINTINMAIVVLVNFVLNLFLIEKFLQNGAALATAISVTLLFFLGLIQVYRTTPFRLGYLISVFLKTAIFSACIGIGMYFIKPYASLYVLLPVSVALYFTGLFLTKILSSEDVKLIYRAVGKKRV